MSKKKRNTLAILLGGAVIVLAVIIAVSVTVLYGSLGAKGYEHKIEVAQQSLARNDYEEAISAYYAAIKMDETREEAYLGLADVYERQGEYTYLNYILSTGYERTHSRQLDLRLQTLRQMLEESKGDSNRQEISINDNAILHFAEDTYGSYQAQNGENAVIRTEQGVMRNGDDGVRVYYAAQGITLFFSSAPDEKMTPEEIQVDDLRTLFSGMESSLLKVRLEELLNGAVEQTTLDQAGSVLHFTRNGCEIWVACDAEGNITSRSSWNRIVPDRAGANDQQRRTNDGLYYSARYTIRSATTGEGVHGATVILYDNKNRKAAEFTSDEDGLAFTDNLSEGGYTAEVSAEGYVTESIFVYVDKWSGTTGEEFVISPVLQTGQIRIVLTWGSDPQDLDARAMFSDNASEQVFWSNLTVSLHNQKTAELDVDDRDGYGPETITVYQTDEDFVFVVFDYLHTGGLGSSDAKVKIYLDEESAPITVDVPSDAANCWTVFKWANGKIDLINDTSEINAVGAFE